MYPRLIPLLAVALLAPLTSTLRAAAASVKLDKAEGRARIELDGKFFTEYVYKNTPRPYFYPVLAADGMQLNRDFPMKNVPGEDQDHPHHRSLWFTHGAVNGVDFWAEGKGKGTIVTESVDGVVDGSSVVIKSQSKWVAADGVVHCTDATTVRLTPLPEGRQIDWEVTIKAPADKPVVMGDTKEGSMAMRLAQWFLPPHEVKKQIVPGDGRIVNAEGITDAKTWGKKSNWVDYSAPKNGKTYGVAMFDNPKNPRFPTWWHVRDYGLFAANPFGQHDFEAIKDNPKAGDLTIPAGGSVTFRYRILLHMGDEKTAKIAEAYKAYAAGK